MKKLLTQFVAAVLVLSFAATTPVDAGDSVSIRLQDGSRWRGQVGDIVEVTHLENRIEVTFAGKLVKAHDQYMVIEGNVAGQLRDKTIHRLDVVSMRHLDDAPAVKASKSSPHRSRMSRSKPAPSDDYGLEESDAPYVFLLPLEGPVGTSFRHDEIEMIGEHADKFGRGQIIVLRIVSNGGLVLEAQDITDAIYDVRKRHRVVAWVEKAISAGCSTAMSCEEIYFSTQGTAGAVTTLAGGSSISGEALEVAKEHFADLAERSGYSKYIAYSMKTNSAICSYTKDPETGEVTFYGDKSGEVLLSDENSNLVFTSSTALDCGFSKGTADTVEELAELLDLPEWREPDNYGRKIAKKWQDTVERCEEEVPKLMRRKEFVGTAGDAVERLGKLIRINEQLIRWSETAPRVFLMTFGSPPEAVQQQLSRENSELRKQLADYRRQRRGR